MRATLSAGLVLLLSAFSGGSVHASEQELSSATPAVHADFLHEHPSPDALYTALWVQNSLDNEGLPFVLVDKVNARVYLFDAKGRMLGASPALIGSARGDTSVPGIGARKLSSIRADERTTPAGRFVASLDRALNGEDILWVDYDSGVALHRVMSTSPQERRLQRLQSSSPEQHRITYGCINVPVKFYEEVVRAAFKGTSGIVYVLPETRPAREVFGVRNAGQQ